jgi:hypothetical protein
MNLAPCSLWTSLTHWIQHQIKGWVKTTRAGHLFHPGFFRPRASAAFYCENPGIAFDINKPCDL